MPTVLAIKQWLGQGQPTEVRRVQLVADLICHYEWQLPLCTSLFDVLLIEERTIDC